MANRLILVPEEIYNNLQTNKSVLDNPIDTALAEAQKELSLILANPSLSSTEKFLFYDQTHKRIQNMLSQKKDNTQKVSFDPEIMEKLEKLQKTITENKIVGTKLNFEDSPITPEFKTPGSVNATVYSTPLGNSSDVEDLEDEVEDVEKLEEEVGQTRRRITKRNLQDEKYEAVFKYINENKSKLGIKDDGKILKESGSPYKNSNLDKIVRRLVGPNTSGSKKPEGFQTLYNKLSKDKNYQTLFTTQKGKGNKSFKKEVRKSFKPILWKKY